MASLPLSSQRLGRGEALSARPAPSAARRPAVADLFPDPVGSPQKGPHGEEGKAPPTPTMNLISIHRAKQL